MDQSSGTDEGARRLEEAERRAADAESKMMQAALYGKELLERNMELEAANEAALQEKHQAGLRLQEKLVVERALLGELEEGREAMRQLEVARDAHHQQEEERAARREEIWKAKLAEAELCLTAVETRERGLQERLETAEQQLKESNDVMNQSLGGSFSAELGDLQAANMVLVQEKHVLQVDLCRARAECEEGKAVTAAAQARVEVLQRDLEEVQCINTGYARAAEASRTEVQELEAVLESMKAAEVDEDGKGNSLFSEVNDRREKVEIQIKIYQEQYETLKANYDTKLAQLKKTKMHNAQLLSMAGTRTDSGHASRLEELLADERNKNVMLREQLEQLDRLDCKTAGPALVEQGLKQEAGPDTEESHTATEEYRYLSTLLADTQAANTDLRRQLKEQIRVNLDSGEKLRGLTGKVNQLETAVQRYKAEIYSLNIKLDELKCKKGDPKDKKKEPVKIVEHIKFDTKTTSANTNGEVDTTEFVLKETLIDNLVTSTEKPPPINISPTKKDKENVNTIKEEEKSKLQKKSAMFAEDVETISAEGNKETALLMDRTPKEKLRPKKPRKIGADNTVVVGENEVAPECKQQ